MKRKILRAVSVAAITGAGLFAFSAPAAAHDGGGMYSSYNAGLFNGNQYSFVFQRPTSFCGNAIAIFGFASAGCHGGAFAYNGG